MPTDHDLGVRLQRAAGPAPDPEPALAAIASHLDRSVWRPQRLLAVAAIVLVLVGAWVASASRQSDRTSVRSGTTTTVPGTTAPPTTTTITPVTTEPVIPDPPPGFLAVADHDGNFAGFVATNDELLPLPELDLGTGPPLGGQPVVDEEGKLTGYFIAGLGFVSKEQASDPAEIDRLVAEHKAAQQIAEEQQAELDQQIPGTSPGD